MNKWLIGFVASLACLLLLSAVVLVMIAIMYSVSYTPAHLAKLPVAIPLAGAGWLLLKWIDGKAEIK